MSAQVGKKVVLTSLGILYSSCTVVERNVKRNIDDAIAQAIL